MLCTAICVYATHVFQKTIIKQEYRITFSYRKFVRKPCPECKVSSSELFKYKNVDRILPEDE